MVTEADLELSDGRTLHCYDTREAGDDGLTAVFWLHGTPNTGTPPEPLFAAAAHSGLRWVSYDRPGYGGSSPHDDRDIASAAADVAAVADALGIGRFAVLGHSGGGPHALACAALLPSRVLAVVSVSAPAPTGAGGLDWFAGWSASGAAEQRAARSGRAALEEYLPTAEFDPQTFTPGDYAALEGGWSWFGDVVSKALEHGREGMVEDLLASARDWGFALAEITVPVLVAHGAADRMVPAAHGQWLAAHCPRAELRLIADAGHITVLDAAPAALDWVRARFA
ncbi:MAG TPA: alpha/beta fold hydrolase [Trebonia sp.]|jgi:pimeloyl-ACP methyl ester carboxylesterase|nr:alpha/beta fold hydrolase [Trebonia sp.]